MKILTGIIAILVAAISFAVDSITVSDAGGNIARITYDWTSDGSGNATGRTTTVVPGILHSVIFTPSASVAPTDNYDVVFKAAVLNLDSTYTTINYDEAGSQCLNRDTANAETVYFHPESTLPHTGYMVIEVTNAGSAKAGRIELFVERTLLPLVNLPYGIPTGGTIGQILQWELSGNAKWVTMSGDATIADGGAVTVSASGLGDVGGPASATDNAIARFDLTTGKIIQNSDVTISDTGEITDGNSNLLLVDNTDITGDVTISGTLTIAGANAIVGSVGAADNIVPRSNGTGTKTLQNSDIEIADGGAISDTDSSLTLGDAVVITSTLDQQGDVSDSTGTYTVADTTALTGAAHEFGATAGTTLTVDLKAAVSNERTIRFLTGATRRWALRTDTDSESGSDAGATLRISAYTDAGSFIDNAVSIARVAGGTFTLNRPLDANSSITSGSGNVLVTTTTGNLALTAPAGTAATSKIVGSDGTNTAWLTPKTKPFIMGARSGEPATTNGCAAPSKTTAAGGREYYTLSFADDADRIAQWETVLPADYNGGTVTCTFYWTVASGSGTVIWGVQACSSTDDETIDQTYGTAVETTDTIIAAADEHVATSSAVTIGGSPAAGHTVNFYVYRQNSDTATVAALLRAVKCEYTPLPY